MGLDQVLPLDIADLVLLGALVCFGFALAIMAYRLKIARSLVEKSLYGKPGEQPDQCMRDTFDNLPHGLALFDAQDRLSFRNAKFDAIFPEAYHHMVPGRSFEEAMTKIARQGTFCLEDDSLERFIAQRLARHRDRPGKPFLQPLNDGRWIQINEIKTASNGTLATWTDVTQLKLREQALAILAERDTGDRNFLEIAAEAMAVGLGCRWAAVAQRVDENRASVLAMWEGGAPGALFEYSLEGSPCACLSETADFCYFPDNVAGLFPDDRTLRDMNAVSYVGHIIRDPNGRMTGQVFALDDRPMSSQPWHRDLIELIARWVDLALAEQQARTSAREDTQRLKDIIEVSADWVWETRPDLRFSYFSDRLSDVLGIDVGQLIGKTREEILGGDADDPSWRQHLADLKARRPFRKLEYTLQVADGTLRHLRINGKPTFDEKGAFLGYRGTGTDLTVEVTARQESMRNLQLLEAVFENLPEGISLADADLNIVAFNRRFLDLLGFPPENFKPGDPFENFIRYNAERGEYGPGDADEQVRERIALAKRFQAHHFERPSFGGGVLEIRGNPIPSGGFVTTYTDISKRRRAEETVKQKSAFIELSKQVTAAANEATSINQAMAVSIKEICRHTAWPIGHVFLCEQGGSGRLLSSQIWHMEQPEPHSKLRTVTAAYPLAADTWDADQDFESSQYLGIHDLAQEAASPRAVLARDLGFKAIFGFPIVIGSEVCGMLEFFSETAGEPSPATLEVMNQVGTQLGRVVERASARRSLLAAKEAAEYANRSKSEFLATMSHELRTPLNAIIGFSELMSEEIYGPLGHASYRDYVKDIRGSGLHLLEIINDILDVSKAEAGRIELTEETLNLAQAVSGAVRLVRTRVQDKPVELKVELPEEPIHILADELRFRQVLLNLLSNSIKFTDSGSIVIRAQVVLGTGLEVQVIDTGIGVSKADLERIFEPFAQVDMTLSRPHEGTGLGLPLSRKLIELHGGTLTLDSTLGEGSVATIRIPHQRVVPASNVA